MLYDKLPDDLLTYIYSKILYPKHKNFLTEIKIQYYITNYLLKKNCLKDLYICLYIYYYKNLTISDIDILQNTVNNFTNIKIKYKILNILRNMDINDKIEYIFLLSDFTIKHNIDIKTYMEIKVLNVINNFID